MAKIYRAVESVLTEHNGENIYITAGETAEEGAAILKGREHLFEPFVVDYPAKEPEPEPAPAEAEVETVETVQAILDRVGGDADAAQAALEQEQARDAPRVTLVAALEKIAGQ